jgi:hypothetical protein
MRRALVRTLAITVTFAAIDAGASCIGSGSFATCTDN